MDNLDMGTRIDDYTFVLETFLEDVLKMAKVNLRTGEFHFIKMMEEEFRLGCLDEKSINGYTQSIVKHGLIHPEECEEYLYHMDRDYLRHQVKQEQADIVYSFRRKQGETYCWLTVEITVPKDYSDDNPWVLYSWKRSSQDSKAMEDALRMLSVLFHKIMKINLTKNSYEIIKIYEAEKKEMEGMSLKLSTWLQEFGLEGNVHKQELEGYLKFCDLDNLKKQFKQNRDCKSYRYRRKIGNQFRWVMLELLPSVEYTDEDQVLMLYVRDIHESHIAEINYQKKLEHYCNIDQLTGMNNRYYYQKWYDQYMEKKQKPSLGIVFADVNGLKYTNDHKGHAAGDELIQETSELLQKVFSLHHCCRISGDEFVVFLENESEEAVKQRFEQLQQLVCKQSCPIVSAGYAWKAHPVSIEEIVAEAEENMYQDKAAFYQKFPELKR